MSPDFWSRVDAVARAQGVSRAEAQRILSRRGVAARTWTAVRRRRYAAARAAAQERAARICGE
jgi:hypothetical protein